MGETQREWGMGTLPRQSMRIVTQPEEDGEFALTVHSALEVIERHDMPPRSALMAALLQLLPRYPQLEIRQQDGLAVFEADPLTWYVYRDGASGARPVD